MAGVFKPGDEVPKSGIYKVTHGADHADEHEVTCLKGEQFPACHGCGHHARFVLLRSAHHVRSHEYFKK